MSKVFKDMPAGEQEALVGSICDLLVEYGLDTDVQPKFYMESVCPLRDTNVHVKAMLIIKGALPISKEDACKNFNEKVKALVDGVEGIELDVKSQISMGDLYQTITNVVPLEKTETVDLAHKAGEVWLLDFWATWCPPCQAPMAHNQEMLEKRGEEWGSNVRIIGLSIDNAMDKLVSHVNEKGWSKVEHYHRASSNCSDQYGVRGVPCVMLIDKEGRIVYRGHPSSRNLEEDIDKLVKGEALTGEGVAKEEAKEEAKPFEFPESYKKLDVEACLQEIGGYVEVGKSLQANETLKEKTKGMMRDFCVMTFCTLYDPKTKESKSEYLNHRVLVGPQHNIDAIKAVLEETVKGSFEVKEQYHPM